MPDSESDPMDDGTTLGALCTEQALDNVQRQIAVIKSGAKVLLGGKRGDRC